MDGTVKVEPLTDFWERFSTGSRLRLNDTWVEVLASRVHKNRPLIRLSGVDSLTKAQALQWQYLEAPAESRPPLEEDEFLTEDLIGMRVITVEGQDLGEVEDVLRMPAHDVIQVGAVLIPAIKEFVKMVDFDTNSITVQLIPGMLEE